MSVEVNDFKEQVRNHANIVEVVSGYVALKKKGRKFRKKYRKIHKIMI